MTWHAYGNGTSTGMKGSEGGTIVLDEEHSDGARITLEQGGHTAPWAITCGVYGSWSTPASSRTGPQPKPSMKP